MSALADKACSSSSKFSTSISTSTLELAQMNIDGLLLDDIDIGLSPLNLSLQGGFHNVAVMFDNYETINDTIEVSRAKPDVNRDYRLELRKAGVNVSLTPSDGKLLLDGITVNNSSGCLNRL